MVTCKTTTLKTAEGIGITVYDTILQDSRLTSVLVDIPEEYTHTNHSSTYRHSNLLGLDISSTVKEKEGELMKV